MSLLVAVETRNLTHVLLLSPLPFTSNLSYVDSGGQVGGILGFFGIFLVLSVLLLLILLAFIGRLGILSGSGGSGCGALKSLGVIPAMVFHRSLGLDFVRGGVSRSILSETTQISLPHIGTRA